jgi:hypothetical protein
MMKRPSGTVWLELIRLMTFSLILSVFVIIFALLTDYSTLLFFHIIIFPVIAFATIIVAFSRSYVLVFFFMVTCIFVLIVDTLFAYKITPNVLVCNSHHCDNGKKWMLAILLIFLVGVMAITGILITSLWQLITKYAERDTLEVLESLEVSTKNKKSK